MAETMTMAMPELFRDLVKKLLAAGVEAGLEYRPVGDLIYIRSGKPWITSLSDWSNCSASCDGDCWSRAN